MEKLKEISCYSCKHFKGCFVRNVVHETTSKVRLNEASFGSYKFIQDIFIIIGNYCLDYKKDEKWK